jgi:hypothetical protein
MSDLNRVEGVTKNGSKAISMYQHIDNGGHTFTIDEHGNLEIQTGFFGYSNTSVVLAQVNFQALADMIEYAKEKGVIR